MLKNISFVSTIVLLVSSPIVLTAGCGKCGGDASHGDAPTLQPTAADQAKLSPKKVLVDLMEGNQRFVSEKPQHVHVGERIKLATKGQFPKAYILSCVDSRVPVEQVFDQNIGDIFVGRVAGNVESIDQLGSMEFAAAAAGVKLIMVLGHEACGAVKGACDDVQLGNLTPLLAEIKPAVETVASNMSGDTSSKNTEFVSKVIETNVQKTLEDIRLRSKVLRDLEAEGEIMLIGGIYSLKTGKVSFLNLEFR